MSRSRCPNLITLLFFNSFVTNYLLIKFNLPFVFLQVHFFCGVAFFLIFITFHFYILYS
jgi:hypothetical protein